MPSEKKILATFDVAFMKDFGSIGGYKDFIPEDLSIKKKILEGEPKGHTTTANLS